WGITPAGNFEGATILHRPVRGDLLRPDAIERARRTLFAAREKRMRPALDDKVLTEWNALFVSALAEAAAAIGRADWLAAADETAGQRQRGGSPRAPRRAHGRGPVPGAGRGDPPARGPAPCTAPDRLRPPAAGGRLPRVVTRDRGGR